MSTKAEILKRLEGLGDEEIIAVPTIKTKLDAEELYEYANDEEIELTAEQWAQVVENYEHAEDYSDEYLVEVIQEVLGS